MRSAANLLVLGVAAYAIAQAGAAFALWLVAGALAHDFLLVPAYTAIDWAVRELAPRHVNYLRVPLALSGILLLVFAPLILVKGQRGGDWALITLALFAGSALAHGVAARRSRTTPRRRARA
jgi:hypothetical protein